MKTDPKTGKRVAPKDYEQWKKDNPDCVKKADKKDKK